MKFPDRIKSWVSQVAPGLLNQLTDAQKAYLLIGLRPGVVTGALCSNHSWMLYCMSPRCPVSYHAGWQGDLVFLLFVSKGFLYILMLVWMLTSLTAFFASSLRAGELMHVDFYLLYTSGVLCILLPSLLCCVENTACFYGLLSDCFCVSQNVTVQ